MDGNSFTRDEVKRQGSILSVFGKSLRQNPCPLVPQSKILNSQHSLEPHNYGETSRFKPILSQGMDL